MTQPGRSLPPAPSARESAVFPAGLESAGAARRFVRDVLARWELDELVDDAVLLASELVTNAVRHGGTAAEVSCERWAVDLQVGVRDGYAGRSLPAVAALPPEDSEGGRGLALLAAMSLAWGVEHDATGKRVWFRLPIGDGAVPGSGRGPGAPVGPPPGTAPLWSGPLSSGPLSSGPLSSGPLSSGRLPAATGPLPSPRPPTPGAAVLASPLSVEELLVRALDQARELLRVETAYALLATEEPGCFEVRAVRGTSAGRVVGTPVDERVARSVNASRTPGVVITPADVGAVLPGAGLRSLLTAPLLVGGRVVGALHVGSHDVGRFDASDAAALQALGDGVALAAESARLTELERRRRGWLTFLAEASELLAGTLDPERTVAMLAQLVVPTVAQWCAVRAADPSAGAATTHVWHADETLIDPLRLLLSLGPPGSVPAAALAAAAPDPAALAVLQALAGAAVAEFPLTARGRGLGTLTVGRAGGAPFRYDELGLTADLARRAGLALDNARLYAERKAVSQALQRSLLPPDLPAVPGCEVAVAYQAAGEGNEVGGDFYDVFALDADRHGIGIGDVCGKGAAAAAVTGLARNALRLLGRSGCGVADVLASLNAAILDEGPRARFITVLYAELRTGAGGATVTGICAGHPQPLLVRRSGEVVPVFTPQPLLGVIDDLELEPETVELAPGEVLVCFTDGVTERRGEAGMLGDDGLAELLRGCAGQSAADVVERVQRAVVGHAAEPPADDFAVLAVRVR